MIQNLVISGGSIKGFIFIGAIKYLEEVDILKNINTFTGTSIGACLSLCLNLNFSANELIEIFINVDIDTYKNINIEDIFNFTKDYGLNDGSKITNIFKIIINAKLKNLKCPYNENITFIELFTLTNKKLTMIGCCLNDMSVVYYDYISTPNFKIIDALRISLSIPFIFKPIKIDNKYYIDGAIINNYPIELYDTESTIGLVTTNANLENNEIKDIENYICSILFTTYNNNLIKKIEKYKSNTINLTYNLNSLDFSISKDKRINIINAGYDQTKILYNKKFKS